MPSINVPLKGAHGWEELMRRRRAFWRRAGAAQLTEHFTAHEFACHDGSPAPTTARPAMVKLCKTYLEPMRKKFGVCLILSGYRHTLYNARIRGARQSQHIYEESFESVATDLRFAKGTPAQWTAELKRLRTAAGGKGGIGRYDRSGFVHCDNRGYRADWSG